MLTNMMQTVELKPHLKKIPTQWGYITDYIDTNKVMVKWSTGGFTIEYLDNLTFLLATA